MKTIHYAASEAVLYVNDLKVPDNATDGEIKDLIMADLNYRKRTESEITEIQYEEKQED